MDVVEHPILSLVRRELADNPRFMADGDSRRGYAAADVGLMKGLIAARRRSWPFHIAAYIAVVELETTRAKAAEIAGCDKRTVYLGLPRIEDRRDDPEFDEWIDSVAIKAKAVMA